MAASRTRRLLLLFSLVMTLTACSSDDDPTAPGDGGVDITPGISSEIHVDEGNVGVVIDVRRIFKKGYLPTTAQITFAAHPRFNAALPVDPFTNLAILDLKNSDLTPEEKTAFAQGVAAGIVVTDANKAVLVSYDDSDLDLDDSNIPLELTTTAPYIVRPLEIEETIPYLMQLEGKPGVLASLSDDFLEVRDFVPDAFTQQFFFTPVPGGGPDTYYIQHFGYDACGTYLAVNPAGTEFSSNVQLVGNQCTPFERSEFVLEQDDEGWVRIKVNGSDRYLHMTQFGLHGTVSGPVERIRIISDSIDWDVQDRGTEYLQPIMPPAKLDFAYSGTLRNCSSATLQETVGRSESRTRMTTASTTESLQLFSSEALTIGLKVGFEVTAKVGVDVEGIGEAGEEVSVSEELTESYGYTTSETATSANTWSSSTSNTSEVSRSRTLTVPPFTGLEVYDAVKTVTGVRVPFTQVLRIRASDKDTGAILSGPEIVTQLIFNFVTGVVSTVGADYVDISIRGYAQIDEVFEATTDVSDIEGACSGL